MVVGRKCRLKPVSQKVVINGNIWGKTTDLPHYQEKLTELD